MTNTQRTKRIVITIIVMITVIVMYGYCAWHETHYTRDAIVIEIEDNTIVVVDTTDNVWEFEGTNYKINDNVKMVMNTMHTDSNIYDDEIEKVTIIK